jgi:hypothetical protein
MIVEREPGRSIGIAAVPDLRRLGGRPTRSGVWVRAGLVCRSRACEGEPAAAAHDRGA